MQGSAKEKSSSSSSEESEEEDDERPKKLPRLSLPGEIAGLFQDSKASAPHQGRIRRVEHVDGNYATHITLPIEPSAEWRNALATCRKVMQSLVSSKQAEVNGFEEEQWHVSLSPLLMLRLNFIDTFLDATRNTIKRSRAGNDLSEVFFESGLRIFAPKDFSRFFIGLVATKDSTKDLQSLLKSLQAAAAGFGIDGDLPWVSQQPHCSLAWTLDDLRPALKVSGAKKIESDWGVCWQLENALSSTAAPLKITVAHICVKVGKKITKIPLR
eukprot:gnl/MRDRNA2_/MRDRNA2_44641_c0_seq1.p1 gnl/MRDRNA2_/MRDRNA2_44641_c0~~gnl/MRDRNA2_/MRDRNA2_44641_c0_seq1.p1  ORF type:complete len:270 (-),score=53.01 gnl/MRDRNA2_/MRDRNA2_44641_c0_seq1:112-921(-)